MMAHSHGYHQRKISQGAKPLYFPSRFVNPLYSISFLFLATTHPFLPCGQCPLPMPAGVHVLLSASYICIVLFFELSASEFAIDINILLEVICLKIEICSLLNLLHTLDYC